MAGNPDTDELQRFKVYDNLNSYTTKKDRRYRAKLLIEAINGLISQGWNPFTNKIAEADQNLRKAIEEAVKEGYKFSTYGDAMLII